MDVSRSAPLPKPRGKTWPMSDQSLPEGVKRYSTTAVRQQLDHGPWLRASDLPKIEAQVRENERLSVVGSLVDQFAEGGQELCPPLRETLDAIAKQVRERFREAVLSEEAVEAAARWPHEQEVPGVWLDNDSWEFDGHDPRDDIRADAQASLQAALTKAQEITERER